MSGYIIRPLEGECYHLLDFDGVVYQWERRKYLTIDIFEENIEHLSFGKIDGEQYEKCIVFPLKK